MEEQRAHELYTLFQQHDAGAKQKQGLGFGGGGGGPARGEFKGTDDDVVARNRRLRGSVFGGEAERQGGPDYDSDSAAAVVIRLKQLKREQGGSGAPSTAAAAAAGAAAGRRDPRPEPHTERRGSREAGGAAGRHASPPRGDGRPQRRSRSRSRERGSRQRDERHSRDPRDGRSSRDHRSSRGEERRDSSRRDVGGQSDRCYSNGGRGRNGYEERGREGRDRDRERGSERDRGRGRDGGGGSRRRQQQQGAKPDFERLIPGYAEMSGAQKLKARTQYLLERSSQRDKHQAERQAERGEGDGGQWTRYAFDQNAYLDEEGGRPGDGGGGGGPAGGEDDSPGRLGLARVNAVTFKPSVAQAEIAGRDTSHEAAIFGRPATLTLGGARPPGSSGGGSGGTGSTGEPRFAGLGSAAAAGGGGLGASSGGWLGAASPSAQAAGSGVEELAAAEGAMVVQLDESPSGVKQGQLSWRERAAQAKAQRARQG